MGPGGLSGPVEGMQEIRGVQKELIRAAVVPIYRARTGFQQPESKSFPCFLTLYKKSSRSAGFHGPF